MRYEITDGGKPSNLDECNMGVIYDNGAPSPRSRVQHAYKIEVKS
jgi:hypothetical protein